MVKIRLRKCGCKNKGKTFQIVAADSRCPRDGKYISLIGFWNPKQKIIQLDDQLLNDWVKKGAVITPAVIKLMSNVQVM